MCKIQRLLNAAAAHKINGEFVGEIKIKFKEDSWWWNLIPFKTIATTFGKTIWIKTRKWYHTNEDTTQRVILHECVHVFDYVRNPLKFLLKYAMPQIVAAMAIPLALLALWTVNLWILWAALGTLLLLAPWPAIGRARLEQRAYIVEVWSIRIEMIKKGWGYYQQNKKNEAITKWLTKVYNGRSYYRMVWGGSAARWARSIIANAANNRQPISEEMMMVIEDN